MLTGLHVWDKQLSCIEQTLELEQTCPSKLKANNLYLKRTNFILFALNELIGKDFLKRLNLIYDNFLLNKPMILNAEFEHGYTVMKASALYFFARPLKKGRGFIDETTTRRPHIKY